MGSKDTPFQTRGSSSCRLGTSYLCPISGKLRANQALQEYSSIKDRPDEGGKRTLRLEYSLVEFCMDEGEKWDRMCTRRVSAVEETEFFIRNAYMKVEGMDKDFEVMWVAPKHWPCNIGMSPIASRNAKSGARDWETETYVG